MAASIAGMMREEETIHDNPVEVGVVEARIGGIEAVVEEEEVNEVGGERVEEEEEEEVDDGSVVDCEQEHDIEVRAVKTPEGHVGIGALITRNDSVLWRESKYVGIGMSWHVAEYGGVLDAMEVAERLGLRFLNVFVSSRVVSEQVNGFWKPKQTNQWMLLYQVQDAMQNFSSFGIRSWPKGSYNNFVTQLAQAAITNHLIGDASSSYSGASTAGAFDGVFHPNVTSHASTSAYSSNSRRESKENCLICLEDKLPSEMATVKKCLHEFCDACLRRHAEVQVQASQVPIRCPESGCSEELEYPEECKQYLTVEVFNILTKRLTEARVPEGDRVYCPYTNCSALMDKGGLDPPGQSTSVAPNKLSTYQKVACAECRRSFCLECRVPWHKNRSCQEYQNLPPDLRDAEESNLYKLAQNQKWQRCKKCRRMIELAEGCYHMTCRCGYEFCYTCGTEWKNKKQQCQCKLWDERNIIRTPRESDDESEDDLFFGDDGDDDNMLVDDFFGYDDEEEFDDVDYDWVMTDVGNPFRGFELVGELHGVNRMFDGLGLEPTVPHQIPFANRLYKTKLCRYYLRPGGCNDGRLCNFAHGEHELRHV